jgi:hypothetical protein
MPCDPDQLRKTCVYESRAPIATAAQGLMEIEGIAAGWKKSRSRLLMGGIALLLTSFVGLALYPPSGVVLFATGIGLFFLRKRYPKGVANGMYRCEFSKALADKLALDTDPKAAATMRLEFAPKQELLSETALPHRKNGKQKFYKAPWFTVENRFLDGTSFTETVDDLIRQRSFTNPRGKSKTKTRTRHMISMRFSYPSEVYGDLSPLAARMQKEIQVPRSALVRGLEVSSRAVKLKALVTESADLAQTSTMLALGVYRMLNLSRRLRSQGQKRFGKGGSQ